MARRNAKQPRIDPVTANRFAIARGREIVARTPLASLLSLAKIEITSDFADAVDPAAAIIYLNPYGKARDEHHWAGVIGHMLLHLGLNHAARREERDPLLWNGVCEEKANGLLRLFGLRPPYPCSPDDGDAEEESAYDRLVEQLEAEKKWGKTPANPFRSDRRTERPDIVGLGKFHPWNRSYERALAQGITRTVEMAVEEAASALTESEESAKSWGPVNRARRWVMNELPLLGALAAQIKVIADAKLCDRTDIGIAAVNAWLGEMYFNPDRPLSDPEVLFVYVHELLHVALLHHTRIQGRDPEVWNYATDFVINGWLVEMGVGRIPAVGALFDPRLKGMSSEEVYDLLMMDRKKCRNLRGFRGKLGDILHDAPGRQVFRGDATTLDDIYRRCLAAGLACPTRGLLPAGLLEEVRSLFTPPVPWDVELARWMDAHVPVIRDPLRTYSRASRRQSTTPDIPRPARYVPQEWKDACTFGVVLDTSGSMDRELLGRALGAIASYAEARDVPAVRLVLCDAAPYDRGIVAPQDLRGHYPVQGRGGTVLQPAINHLISRPDFPSNAPIMVITDGWCEEELVVPRDHCFVLPRKGWKEGAIPLRTSAPVFRVLKEERYA